jgi:hypothetical protein
VTSAIGLILFGRKPVVSKRFWLIGDGPMSAATRSRRFLFRQRTET